MAINRLTSAALVFVLFALCAADISKRTVKIQLYPDCDYYPECVKHRENGTVNGTVSKFPNVAYVTAQGLKAEDDILHFVMTTVNVPTLLVIHTRKDANEHLSFNWTRLLALYENGTESDLDGAIQTNGTGIVQYSSAVVFSRLIEYDDWDDDASLTVVEKKNKTRWNIRDFTEFDWLNVTLGQGGNSILFNTTQPQPAPYQNNSQGCMYFEFEVNSDGGRDSDLPRLMYNANNTQINFALDGYIPSYNKSRFALEMTLIANHSSQGMSVQKTKSIDDEYSPGVFRMVNWFSHGNVNNGTYIQWKPVCYLKPKRERDVGTEVMDYGLHDPSTIYSLGGLLNQTAARAFYGESMDNDGEVIQKASNVSFGLSKDGYYLKHNYTVWTSSVGYGAAPVEHISTMVIIIIASGLGIPVIIILFGGVYLCFRRKRNSGYLQLGGDLSRDNSVLN